MSLTIPLPFAVLVCGGRDYADRKHVFAVLDEIHAKTPIKMLINGGANGADAHARAWAKSRCALMTVTADWKTHGKSAGPLRNASMLKHGKPALVVAFPGGRGTADMIGKARAAGVEVREIAP